MIVPLVRWMNYFIYCTIPFKQLTARTASPLYKLFWVSVPLLGLLMKNEFCLGDLDKIKDSLIVSNATLTSFSWWVIFSAVHPSPLRDDMHLFLIEGSLSSRILHTCYHFCLHHSKGKTGQKLGRHSFFVLRVQFCFQGVLAEALTDNEMILSSVTSRAGCIIFTSSFGGVLDRWLSEFLL